MRQREDDEDQGRNRQEVSLVGFFALTFALTRIFWVPGGLLFSGQLSVRSPFSSVTFVLQETAIASQIVRARQRVAQ